MINCFTCEADIPEDKAWTCRACYYPFCDRCWSSHFYVGYHSPEGYVDDGIRRPPLGILSFRQAYPNGPWVPSTEPFSWGNWTYTANNQPVLEDPTL